MSQRTCSILDCDRPVRVKSRGWCSKHYQRWQYSGDPNGMPPRDRVVGVAPCSVEGCEKLIVARGWCTAHWTRWKRHGSPTARLRGEVVDGRRICSLCEEDKLVGAEINDSWCKACMAARMQERRPEWVPVDHDPIPCLGCGEDFKPPKKSVTHCSPECSRLTIHQRNRKHLHARRARLLAATVEAFDPYEVFDRDGWICQICGGEIDPAARRPDQLCVSLDHIIPLSRGGEHSRANTQAAHLICNVKKGVSVA